MFILASFNSFLLRDSLEKETFQKEGLDSMHRVWTKLDTMHCLKEGKALSINEIFGTKRLLSFQAFLQQKLTANFFHISYSTYQITTLSVFYTEHCYVMIHVGHCIAL